MSLVTLVSFDIDGTLECGEPPGIVPIALVRTAKRLGYLVGSCSDRPLGYQQALWERLGIAVDFTVLKHR
ncbi:MAG TPA: HAD family hydrolase, partial [Patescibacteria group bacterium]|nr:HAD family hydrolase [Patescibacteria group bacterium]